MRYFLLGVATALLGVLGFQSYEAFRWKQVTDIRGWRADQCYTYLSQPAVQMPDGKRLTRAQAVDLLIQQAIRKTP